jgi:hypothetical protein
MMGTWQRTKRALGAVVAVSALIVSASVSSTACVGDSPPPAGETCETYCSTIARSCTGPNRQYRDEKECLATCGKLPEGDESDGALNTVGCRLRQARAAATLEQCTAAGPFGGGLCGSRCEAFCAINARTCGEELGPLQPFRSEATCLEQCSLFTFDPDEGEGPSQDFSGNDTVNCRSFHLILAQQDAEGHCPHTAPASSVCRSASPTGDAGSDGGS